MNEISRYFELPLSWVGRPQILLIGNGFERENKDISRGEKQNAGKTWDELLDYLAINEEARAEPNSIKQIGWIIRAAHA